jgi:prepilin-type N-terminal cleavage/methylation domain-containing protein
MNLKLNKIKGFTLIELLVVASIISLLSSIVLSSLNSARMKARNVARIEMAHVLRTALQLGFSETGSFPPGSGCLTTACAGFGAPIPGGVMSQNPTIDAYLAPYLPSKPDDSFQGLRGAVGIAYWFSIYPGAGFSYPVGTYMDYILEQPATCGTGASPRVQSYYWLECLVPLK